MSKQKATQRKPKLAKKAKAANTSKSEPKSKGNYIDAFVKRILGRIFVFVDFLLHYGDKEFVAEIDLRKIKPAPTHYLGKDGKERILDLMFQCPLKHGGDLMAVIIFEHQSRDLKEIPRRLHKYVSAIWDAERKAGRKNLSAPYFLVLRTGKTPHRGDYPTMADLLPKGRDGKPLGHVPEIKYKVVDLPAWEFKSLVGGPVLRLTLGMLHKMTGGHEDEFPEALLPLLEITDQEEKVELTDELLQFVETAFAASNRQLDEAMVDEALKPIYKDWERAMIKTLSERKYDEGIAVGEARGEARGEAKVAGAKVEAGKNMLLTFLRGKFGRVPKEVEKSIRQMTDPVALESLAAHAAQSETMGEFAETLH